MKPVENSIEIKASPEQVWAALTELEGYARWHPFLAVSGECAVGSEAELKFGNKAFRRSFTSLAKITRVNAPTDFGWTIGIKSILLFEETFRVEPCSGGTRLSHGLAGRGFLMRVAPRSTERRLRSYIVATDQALDRHLRKPNAPTSVPGNRLKRRTEKARASQPGSKPRGGS